jgi:hypothetical protein
MFDHMTMEWESTAYWLVFDVSVLNPIAETFRRLLS